MLLKYNVDPRYDKEAAIMADGLRRFGIDASASGIPRSQASDPEVAVSFPALANNSGGQLNTLYGSANTPTPQNRFTGRNRGSWINAKYDQLLDAFSKSLDRAERTRALVQMARVVNEELPSISLYYNVYVVAYTSALQGVTAGGSDGTWWNMHLWEFR